MPDIRIRRPGLPIAAIVTAPRKASAEREGEGAKPPAGPGRIEVHAPVRGPAVVAPRARAAPRQALPPGAIAPPALPAPGAELIVRTDVRAMSARQIVAAIHEHTLEI